MSAGTDNAASPVPAPRRRPGMLRAAGLVTRLGLVAYLGLLLVMMFFENSLLFFPSRYPIGSWNPPGLEFEDVYFNAQDGTRLHGWYLPSERPRAAVLFSHGNGGNITDSQDIARILAERLGASVFLYDYRGYGRSEGSPSEAGVLQDARAARTWLAGRVGVAESEIVLMGQSLGGAVAVDLATDGARGLILDSAFSTLADVASYHYPWAPVRLLLHSRFDNVGAIERYRGPLLQIHGEVDGIVPLELAQRLFAAAHEPKRFVLLEGVNHNDLRPREAIRAIDQFLSELPAVVTP